MPSAARRRGVISDAQFRDGGIENLHPKTIVQSFQLLSLSFSRFSGVPTATFMPSRILRHSSLPGNGCAQPSIQARRRRVGRATVARLGVIPRNLDPAPYQAREPFTRPGLMRGRTSWRGAGDCATYKKLRKARPRGPSPILSLSKDGKGSSLTKSQGRKAAWQQGSVSEAAEFLPSGTTCWRQFLSCQTG